MIQLPFTSDWGKENVATFMKGEYANNGNLYIEALAPDEDGDVMPYCSITVNLNEKTERNRAYVDLNNADRGLLKAMVEAGYMTFMFRYKHSGWCQYPLYTFSQKFLDNIATII